MNIHSAILKVLDAQGINEERRIGLVKLLVLGVDQRLVMGLIDRATALADQASHDEAEMDHFIAFYSEKNTRRQCLMQFREFLDKYDRLSSCG